MLRSTLATGTLVLALGSLAFAATRFAARQEMPQPDQHHAFLQKGVGDWEGTMTTFMTGMPADPIPATQSVVAVGPFWTQSTFHCQFMGSPYTGTGVLGYDPGKGKFVGTWIDSMSPTLALMEGEQRKDGTLVMHWTAPDMTGAIAPHRYEFQRKNEVDVTTFYVGEGEGVKTMTIELRRKDAAREASSGK